MSIFLSYRRADSEEVVGRIYDRLIAHFPMDRIFRDLDSLTIGKPFPKAIEEAVAKAQVALVVIGPKWTSMEDCESRRRLSNPSDFVRLEVEKALNAGFPVVPVLVSNAEMPLETDLPEQLRTLCFRTAVRVRPDPDFHRDMDSLIGKLSRLLEPIENPTQFTATNGKDLSASETYRLVHNRTGDALPYWAAFVRTKLSYEFEELLLTVGGRKVKNGYVNEEGSLSLRFKKAGTTSHFDAASASLLRDAILNDYRKILKESPILDLAGLLCGVTPIEIKYSKPRDNIDVWIKDGRIWLNWDLKNTLLTTKGVGYPIVDSISFDLDKTFAQIIPWRRGNFIRGKTLEKAWRTSPESHIRDAIRKIYSQITGLPIEDTCLAATELGWYCSVERSLRDFEPSAIEIPICEPN